MCGVSLIHSAVSSTKHMCSYQYDHILVTCKQIMGFRGITCTCNPNTIHVALMHLINGNEAKIYMNIIKFTSEISANKINVYNVANTVLFATH